MILLDFGGKIKGPSTFDGHDDWIIIEAIQMGVGRAISPIGGGVDRDTSNPSFSEITLSKLTDIASSDLWMESICGKSLGTCVIHFTQTGGVDKNQQVYLTVELHEPIISSFSLSSNGERPVENFSINFTQISVKYDAFSGDKITTGTAKKWDLLKNKKI